MNTILLFGMLLTIGAIASRFARHKGRNPRAWFILGFLFGLLGLLVLFLLPPVKQKARAQMLPQTPVSPSPSPFVKKILIEALDSNHSDKLWYYLDENQKQLGPMSLQALSDAWTQGKVRTNTFVWNENLSDWQSFDQVLKPL